MVLQLALNRRSDRCVEPGNSLSLRDLKLVPFAVASAVSDDIAQREGRSITLYRACTVVSRRTYLCLKGEIVRLSHKAARQHGVPSTPRQALRKQV